MRSFHLAALAAAFSFACSSSVVTDDVLPDSGGKDGSVATDSGKTDGSTNDSGKDSGMDGNMDDGSMMDGSIADATNDGGGFDAQPLDGGIGSLSGLVLWLDAAKGVTKNNQNQVSKWADQSSAANDATQSSGSLQPIWNGSVINGFPAMRFTINNAEYFDIADKASLQWGTGDFLVAVVARFDNDYQNNEYGTFYGKLGQNDGVFFIANDGANGADGLSAAIDGNNFIGYGSNYSDNTARLYAFQRSGSTLSLRTNGSQVTSAQQSGSVDVSASGVGVTIGDDGTGQLPVNGDIAEVVAVKGSISGQDLQSLEAFLKSKYNL